MNDLINAVQPHPQTDRHILYDDVLLSSPDACSLLDDTERTIDHIKRSLPISSANLASNPYPHLPSLDYFCPLVTTTTVQPCLGL